DRKSTRLNSSHVASSYAVFCRKKITQVAARRERLVSGAGEYRRLERGVAHMQREDTRELGEHGTAQRIAFFGASDPNRQNVLRALDDEVLEWCAHFTSRPLWARLAQESCIFFLHAFLGDLFFLQILRDGGGGILGRIAPSAAARRDMPHHGAGADFRHDLRRKGAALAVACKEEIPRRRAGLTARQSPRPYHGTVRADLQYRAPAQEPDVPPHGEPAAILSGASRVGDEAVMLHAD